MSNKTHLRFNLRVLMALKGIKTITEVAEDTGLSRYTLTKISNNDARRIDLNTLENYVIILTVK
jgi:DNA-binding Xre family transcriptional regulator